MKIEILEEKQFNPIELEHPSQNSNFSIDSVSSSPEYLFSVGDELEVFIHQTVRKAIWDHSSSNTTVELGGALFGFYCHDKGKRFLLITDVLNQPTEYCADPAMLRFTKDFYDELADFHEFISKSSPNFLHIGQYHTHPNFGVFLSLTDVLTFKSIFKGPHQLTMVVDPLKKEDGVFFWHNKDVSERHSYKVFTSKSEKYNPHVYSFSRPEFFNSNKIINKNNKGNNNLINDTLIRNSDLTKLHFTPRICPLYDYRFHVRSLPLKKYIRSLNTPENQIEFEFPIFIKQELKDEIQAVFNKNERNLIFTLAGQFCRDHPKKFNYLFIDKIASSHSFQRDVKLSSLIFPAFNSAMQNANSPIAWLAIVESINEYPYLILDAHKSVFNRDNSIGIILEGNHDNSELNWGNARIISFNSDKNTAFDYFDCFYFFSEK